MSYMVEFVLTTEQENRLAQLAVALEQDKESLFEFLMKAGSEAVVESRLALGERMAACRVS